MHTSLLLSAVAIGAWAQSTTYFASLPASAFDKAAYPRGGNAIGKIQAESAAGVSGVNFTVLFANLPSSSSALAFTYHIHARSVPADGNCTATGGHLNPYNRSDSAVCDSRAPDACQVGDLSGKHGKITSDPFIARYTDLYASTDPASPAFFGNLSFVLHYPNMTRISCANFAAVHHTTACTVSADAGADASGTAMPNAVVTAGAPARRAAVYAVVIVAALIVVCC